MCLCFVSPISPISARRPSSLYAQVPSIFNESKTIFAAVYQMTFILAFVVPTAAYVADPLVSQIARQAGLSVGIFACIGILFWPSLSAIYFPAPTKKSSRTLSIQEEALQLINCPECGENIVEFVGRIKGMSGGGSGGGGGGGSNASITSSTARSVLRRITSEKETTATVALAPDEEPSADPVSVIEMVEATEPPAVESSAPVSVHSDGEQLCDATAGSSSS